MTKRALIHIGSSKTGTSSIQEALHQVRNSVPGLTYPQIPVGDVNLRSQHALMLLIPGQNNKLPRRLMHLAPPEKFARYAQQARDALAKEVEAAENIVLSAEYLFSIPRGRIQRLLSQLSEMGVDDITVCAYVREPESFYTSYVQQYCKVSHDVPSPEAFHYQFRKCLRRWRKTVGDRLIVRPFKRDLLRDGDIVSDFFGVLEDRFGIEMPRTKIAPSNEALSLEALRLLVNYRKRYYADREHAVSCDTDNLVQVLTENRQLPCTPLKLRREAADFIYAKHHEDLAWLRIIFGIDFTRKGSEALVDPSKLNQLETIFEADGLCSEGDFLYSVMSALLGRTESA